MTERKFTVRANPVVYFEPTIKELSLLIELAEDHYDASCRIYGKAKISSWWRSVHSGVTHKPPYSAIVAATFRELDTCVKILENRPKDPTFEKMALRASLVESISKILRECQIRSVDWTFEVLV